MRQIFRIKDILYGIQKNLGIIISLTVGGLLVGILIFIVQTFSASGDTTYKVYASFAVTTPNSNGYYVSGMASPGDKDFSLASTLVESTMYLARSGKVCGAIVNRLELMGVTTKSVQSALSLSQYNLTPIIEATLKWDNEEQGMQIINALLDELPKALREVMNLGSISKIEGPVVTTVTTRMDDKIVIELTAVGFLLGLLYSFTQLYIHPTLIDSADVEDLLGLNLMAEVNIDKHFDEFISENPITNRGEMDVGLRENYTSLAHILAHQIDAEFFCMFVTSATRGEGRTTMVANLGVELAAMDKRILLIDFDLSNPNLGGYFVDNIDYKHTLNAVYFDDVSAREALLRINQNLYILPARLEKRHLGIDRFAKKLVGQLESAFDIILIDTSPVGEVSDTLYMANVCKDALFMVRYDHAWCDVIQDSVDKLNKAGATIIGCVVNCVPQTGKVFRRGSEAAMDDVQEKKPSVLPFLHGHKGKNKAKKRLLDSREKQSRSESGDDFDNDDDLLDDDLAELNDSEEKMQTDEQEKSAPAAPEDEMDALLDDAPEDDDAPQEQPEADDDELNEQSESMDGGKGQAESVNDADGQDESMDDAEKHSEKEHAEVGESSESAPRMKKRTSRVKRDRLRKRKAAVRTDAPMSQKPETKSSFNMDDWDADYENDVSQEEIPDTIDDEIPHTQSESDWDSESDSGYER